MFFELLWSKYAYLRQKIKMFMRIFPRKSKKVYILLSYMLFVVWAAWDYAGCLWDVYFMFGWDGSKGDAAKVVVDSFN